MHAVARTLMFTSCEDYNYIHALDDSFYSKQCSVTVVVLISVVRPLLYCPSALTNPVMHCQLVSEVISSLTDLREPSVNLIGSAKVLAMSQLL